MKTLAGRRALVTGGASGIGRACALLLAEAGAAVAVADLESDSADSVAAEIRSSGGRAIGIACDVSRDQDCRRTIDAVVNEFRGLDLVVTSAGVIRRADVIETTLAEWDRAMAVNVGGVFLIAKYALPVMTDGGGGSIVTIGSGWGLKGGPKAASYCASKGAVVNLTRAMAIDHGPAGIRVNCVCPGDTDTPMLRSEASQLGENDATFLAASSDRPLQRLGTPEDVARAVVYLSSDAASWVTGSILVVDGGGLA